jgi:hypothetical protein
MTANERLRQSHLATAGEVDIGGSTVSAPDDQLVITALTFPEVLGLANRRKSSDTPC